MRARDTEGVGVSEVEFLGSGPEDRDEPDHESDHDPKPPSGSAPDSGPDSGIEAGVEVEEAGYSSGRWRRPRLRRLSGPVAALLTAVLVLIAAGAFAFARQGRTDEAFNVTLISAQYSLPQDASGINLAIAVQNTGPAMVELTGIAVYQPGLIRLTQTGDAAGVTEAEAGATTVSALGTGTAITPVAMPPKDVEIITVPFRYDCNLRTDPPVARSISLAGFNARGAGRTAQLALPHGTTPWELSGEALRTAVCGQPSPQADLKVGYGGIGNTLMALTPIRFNYSIELTAPAANSITVRSISQDNPGITGSIDPGLPVVVLDGQTVRLTVTWQVMSCVIATSVHSGGGVLITASKGQSVQTWDAKLGAQFTKDLDAEITTVCWGS